MIRQKRWRAVGKRVATETRPGNSGPVRPEGCERGSDAGLKISLKVSSVPFAAVFCQSLPRYAHREHATRASRRSESAQVQVFRPRLKHAKCRSRTKLPCCRNHITSWWNNCSGPSRHCHLAHQPLDCGLSVGTGLRAYKTKGSSFMFRRLVVALCAIMATGALLSAEATIGEAGEKTWLSSPSTTSIWLSNGTRST